MPRWFAVAVAILASCVLLSACGSRAPSPGAASRTGRVVVTGYRAITLSGGHSQPTSVTLNATDSRRLDAAFDSVLWNGPVRDNCHALAVLYRIAFYEGDSTSPGVAFGEGCGGDNVWYTLPKGNTQPRSTPTAVGLDAGCRLLKVVVSLLPPGYGVATRSALPSCLQLARRS